MKREINTDILEQKFAFFCGCDIVFAEEQSSMKNKGFLAILMAPVFLSGCMTMHRVNVRVAGAIAPSVEKLVVNNNSDFVLVAVSNGKMGPEQQKGESIVLGFYQFTGYSIANVDAKAYCPRFPLLEAYNKRLEELGSRRKVFCKEGEYMGITYPRSVSVYSGQDYRTFAWNIRNSDIIDSSGRSYE